MLAISVDRKRYFCHIVCHVIGQVRREFIQDEERMAETAKIQVKIGNAEFSAEGSEGVVQKQFDLFMAALERVPAAMSHAAPAVLQQAVGGNGSAQGEVTGDVLSRLFLEDKGGYVSLRVMPKTGNPHADALILLLYGYNKLKSQTDTLALHLLVSAKQSGFPLPRIDRTIDAHKSLFNRGGQKRGTRYALNNQGVLFAEDLIRQMLK